MTQVPPAAPERPARAQRWVPPRAEGAVRKPTVADLGIAADALSWQRSGEGEGAIEVAFARAPAGPGGEWVLMRVAGDQDGRILVFDMHEWECFLDGVRNAEFDDALG